MGITGVLRTWFMQGLAMYTIVKLLSKSQYYSYLLPVNSGVPQGSIFGSAFLSLHIICHHIAIHHTYFLNDTKWFLHISTPSYYMQCPAERCHCSVYLIQAFWLRFLTSRNLFTYHSNVSWTPHILYPTHAYHTLILIKILDSFYQRIYAGINTTKPLLHMLTKWWG